MKTDKQKSNKPKVKTDQTNQPDDTKEKDIWPLNTDDPIMDRLI